MEPLLIAIISGALATGVVIMFAGIGELLLEHTGGMNIGLDGMIAMGAVTAVIVINGYAPNVWLGLLAAILVGLLVGAFYALITIKLRLGQFYTGLAFNFIGNGIAGVAGRPYNGIPSAATLAPIRIPILADIPVLGPALFNQNILVYVAYFILPWAAYYLLFKTRHGMNMRSAGQNPKAADACGIGVNQLRFGYMVLDGILCFVAGAYLTLALTPTWSDSVVAGIGWVAFTLVIFSGWNPKYLILGAIVFGATRSISFIVQIQGWGIHPSLLGMAPYLVTILLVAIPFLVSKQEERLRVGVGPAARGADFVREG